MIHEIRRELSAALSALGCPFPVVDGPEGTQTTTFGRERIVFERDETAGDSFVEPRSQKINPRLYKVRNIALKISIFAQSVAAGAASWEHQRRAEHVLHQVLVSLEEIASARKNGLKWGTGRFVRPKDLEASEVLKGAVYEIKLTFEQGIVRRTWAGAAAPEFTLGAGSMRSITKVSQGNNDDVPPGAETACGA